jgi:hypothetical protein
MHPTPKRRRENTITSVLLLALLALNLVHGHSHFGSIAGLSTFNPNTAVSTSKEGREGTNDKLQPCLACACQKQSLVIFSSSSLLFEPLRVNHKVLEHPRTFLSQLFLSPVLSRAPPVLS